MLLKRLVGIGAAVALSAGLLAGCSDTGDAEEYTEICLNSAGVRVPEYQCDGPSAGPYGYYWSWYPVYYGLPAYGGYPAAGGVRTLPATARKATTRPPASGQSATKKPTVWRQKSTAPAGTGGSQTGRKVQPPTTTKGSGGGIKTQPRPAAPPRTSTGGKYR